MPNTDRTHCRQNGTHRNGAPVYHECPECFSLLADPTFADGSQPCPHCHATGPSRAAVPAQRLRRFDERVRGYHRDGEHEIVVILVSTLLETIFEDILARMMQANGANTSVTKLVLDTERSVGMRLGKLFPTLAGETFENVAAELGYQDFPHRWRKMRAERNAFIHGESFDDPRETLDARAACEAMSLLDQAYDLFVSINNRFVVGGLKQTKQR